MIFLVLRNSSNKRKIWDAALIKGGGGGLINFYVQNAALIRLNTVCTASKISTFISRHQSH